MDIEQYSEQTTSPNDSFGEDKWKSVSDATPDSENNISSAFDCNICLEAVQDPVVTLCGHLYCWPCLYKWLNFQGLSTENQDGQKQQQCPVCKAEISEESLVPLYGKGQPKRSKGKTGHLDIVVPRRPLGPPCGVDIRRPASMIANPYQTQQLYQRNYAYQSQQYHPNPQGYATSSMLPPGSAPTNVFDPSIGVFGEMVYARMFGNTMTNLYSYPNSYHQVGSRNPRVRRHVMQADKSLNRICFFLFCCAILCLLSF